MVVEGGTFSGNAGVFDGDKERRITLFGAPESLTKTDTIDGGVNVAGAITSDTPIRLRPDGYPSGFVAVTGTGGYYMENHRVYFSGKHGSMQF